MDLPFFNFTYAFHIDKNITQKWFDVRWWPPVSDWMRRNNDGALRVRGTTCVS